MTRGSELGVGAPGSWKVPIRLRLVRLRVLVAERDFYVIVNSQGYYVDETTSCRIEDAVALKWVRRS